MGERRKAMARTWTRRSHAGGLAAIAAVLLALALALAATTRTNALEVTSSETYYVPVRLRGNLYLVPLTQTSFSYDEGREEAEGERDLFSKGFHVRRRRRRPRHSDLLRRRRRVSC